MDVPHVARRGPVYGRPAAGRQRPVHDRHGDEDAVRRPGLIRICHKPRWDSDKPRINGFNGLNPLNPFNPWLVNSLGKDSSESHVSIERITMRYRIDLVISCLFLFFMGAARLAARRCSDDLPAGLCVLSRYRREPGACARRTPRDAARAGPGSNGKRSDDIHGKSPHSCRAPRSGGVSQRQTFRSAAGYKTRRDRHVQRTFRPAYDYL